MKKVVDIALSILNSKDNNFGQIKLTVDQNKVIFSEEQKPRDPLLQKLLSCNHYNIFPPEYPSVILSALINTKKTSTLGQNTNNSTKIGRTCLMVPRIF